MVKASVVWLNYNSMKFIDTVLKSLESFLSLDFNDYELIIVDNASTDGSFERIRKFIEERRTSNVRIKLIRSERNLGYAGGMNIGWDARDPDSRYVAFANNDLIATPQSLTKMIEYMQSNEKIGAASGLIYRRDGKSINSAGWTFDDILTAISICSGVSPSDCTTINELHYVTHADGSYCVVNASIIKRFGFDGKPFIDETFLYADDSLLGIRLWNLGYLTYYVPVEVGIHYGGLTTKSSGLNMYYLTRAKFIAYAFIKTTYYNTVLAYYARVRTFSWILCKAGFKKYCTMYKAIVDGWRLGLRLRSKFGFLDLNKAPHIRLPRHIILAHVVFPVRSTFLRKRFVTHNDLILTHQNHVGS